MKHIEYSNKFMINACPSQNVCTARMIVENWKSKDSYHTRCSKQNTHHVVNKSIASSKVTDRRRRKTLQNNTLPWWYVLVTVGHIFCHACTSMTILWQNQDSHTCAVIEVFHDITKIIITEVSTSMTINRASQKCFRQGWPTCGIHHNGTLLSYRVGFWIR